MSTAANSYYFRRRTIGRAASPPTWACYEEIPYDDDYSSSCSDDDDDSCSEDDEDYHPQQNQQQHHPSQVGRPEHSSDSEESENGKTRESTRKVVNRRENNGSSDMDMDMDHDAKDATTPTPTITGGDVKEKSEVQKDVKGKQRAVDPEPGPATHGRRHRKKERQPTYTLRPILTIHRSQGFVWNQDLFIPPYAKDRYVASTSPPNARGFLSSNSSNTDYEVEVVEIRVKEGELDEYFH
ncbi:hypothetical protein AN958_01992 [Leucoagaricus sp. SymC.cos]|nr:hypothetical protein AN958_01992 [Leucoagaricus sp. SymC.cos]